VIKKFEREAFNLTEQTGYRRNLGGERPKGGIVNRGVLHSGRAEREGWEEKGLTKRGLREFLCLRRQPPISKENPIGPLELVGES